MDAVWILITVLCFAQLFEASSAKDMAVLRL